MSECSICGKEVLAESHDGTVCSGCFNAPSTASSKAKTFQSVVKSMSELKPVEYRGASAPKEVKVFSRQYRNKVCEIATGVNLMFDETGHALMAAHLLPQLQEYTKYKPGRVRVVTDVAAPEVEIEVRVGEDPQEGTEIEVFVGEEPQDGIEIEIIVGDEPSDDPLVESFFGETLEKPVKEDSKKNKKDKNKSSNKKNK